ncbi:MAG: undecaprenyl-diphosphate phosphatase [Planctomycetota bacterium]|nr:undecaprenyl-diphosphate phosphatase [Planctomycetota bacterium]
MSETLQAFVLGVIEGLTEFLPISSTGHMVIAMPLLGVDADAPPWPVFLYFIQIGAIVAVMWHFRRSIWRQLKARPIAGLRSHLLVKLAVAMIPGAIVGLTLDDFMEAHLEDPMPVAIALAAGAGVMVLVERLAGRRPPMRIDDVGLSQALWVGLAQCIAVIPGASRAMVTIMGGIACGLPAAIAAEFSFYLAIPTLCGAGALRIFKHRADITVESAGLLGIGFLVSFVVALAVVSIFMRYIQTRPLWPFAIYRVLLGAAVLAWIWGGR